MPPAQPELDPDTLRSGLRDFLQELRDAHRQRVNDCFKHETDTAQALDICRSSWTVFVCVLPALQDDAQCQLMTLQRELEEQKLERECAENRSTQLQNSLKECQEGLNTRTEHQRGLNLLLDHIVTCACREAWT